MVITLAKKNFFKKNKGFFVGLTIGLVLVVGMVAGINMAIDSSIVNQLQHFTAEERSNDMFNPIVVNNNLGFIEIEITLPHLTEMVPTDGADLLVSYWMIPNPINSVLDWFDYGIFLNDFLIWGEELDSYCDTPDPTDTYYTHFYRMWTVDTLIEGYTYALYCDFYDADGTFWACENDWMPFGGEPIPAMDLNIELPEGVSEEDIEDALLDCNYISFFEYQVPTDQVPYTPPTEGSEDVGAVVGWMNQYTIFSGMKNGTVILLSSLILGIIAIVIIVLLYMKKKKKK